MPKTDTSEKGLEALIVTAMTGQTFPAPGPKLGTAEDPAIFGGTGWLLGDAQDYDRNYCVDLAYLRAFLDATQPETAAALDLANDSPMRRNFLNRLKNQINSRGVIEVLRLGIKHEKYSIDLFYATPSPGNDKAALLYAANRFSVTRQLRYSMDETQRALDVGLFINGLPVATFELKNSLTKQTVADAVEQYQRDRNPREPLFAFGRCVAHLAVDDHEVMFCTELLGKKSWFLPFNQGWNDGAGNPPNELGLKTDFLWKRILTPKGLTDILENYAEIVEEKNEKTGKITKKLIFPRYHQLDVVRKLLESVNRQTGGRKYLIQHSAGSGKSNSIAWLARQLLNLRKDSKDVFDSMIVITHRRILDKQIRDTIKGFAQVDATVGHATDSAELLKLIEEGKKIIITTVQKFPVILDEIGSTHRKRTFAIIIDEAHSNQGGKSSAAISGVLGEAGHQQEEETFEDKINRIMESRKLLSNASYFAFTATPKNKTLEMFGEPLPPDPDGKVKYRPFHSYTMKQAIQEGFILDVLKSYTTVDSYYKLVKKIEGDPEFDTKRAKKKLRKYVEGNDHAIGLKAEIMVDHFHESVLGCQKIGGQARAMVVCNGVQRAIQYYHAFKEYLVQRKSPYEAIVAFSGEHEYGGAKVTESSLNGFPSIEITEKIQEDPYRYLICADKFQTGYDEPLLHTMYVDKTLAGIQAVQTLSRINRAHPLKHDVFVLDFMNNVDGIKEAFADYYRTTILSEETDPNKLHDLQAALDSYQVYAPKQIEELVALFLGGADRDKLDPILDRCVAVFIERLDENAQVDFKGKAKAFLRAYDFLSSILPYTNKEWEKLSIFLNYLVAKLPAPMDTDLSQGILDTIDMDSYRAEKKATLHISLPDENAQIEPVPTTGGGRKAEPELDRLSNILKTFNDHFGTLFTDADRVIKHITDDIVPQVAADKAYQNAKKNTPDKARLELESALSKAILGTLSNGTELFKQFTDNDSFKRAVTDMVYELTNG